MKTEQIKQMAEDKAMEKYPFIKMEHLDTGFPYDANHERRQAYAQAIIDNYKEPERVYKEPLIVAPNKEKYGWYENKGFDDLSSAWMYEDGEEEYYKELAKYEASQQLENNDGEKKVFTENDIAQLQDRIHKIVGNGEVMQEFNKLLGVQTR